MFRLVFIQCVVVILSSVTILIVQPNGLTGATDNDIIPYSLTVSELDTFLGVTPNIEIPEENVRVLYFHRFPGCATCQKMAKMVYEIIDESFSTEVCDKRVILRYYDFEDPKNEKLVKAFKVKSPSLVLVQTHKGKQVRAKFADQIWTLSSNREKFFQYVEKEIRDYLPEDRDTLDANNENSRN